MRRRETQLHPSLPLEGEGDKRLVARDQFVANIGVHPASIRSTRSASSAAARGRPIDAATAAACGSLIVEANSSASSAVSFSTVNPGSGTHQPTPASASVSALRRCSSREPPCGIGTKIAGRPMASRSAAVVAPARVITRCAARRRAPRSEEHTSELQSLMRISYAVFCLKKKKTNTTHTLTMQILQNKQTQLH